MADEKKKRSKDEEPEDDVRDEKPTNGGDEPWKSVMDALSEIKELLKSKPEPKSETKESEREVVEIPIPKPEEPKDESEENEKPKESAAKRFLNWLL